MQVLHKALYLCLWCSVTFSQGTFRSEEYSGRKVQKSAQANEERGT